MSNVGPAYAVMLRPGGRWEVIRRSTDTFGKDFYRVMAEAADEWSAREIADGMNEETEWCR